MKELFNKMFKETKNYEEATEIEKTESEEWIWVEGYKGTKSDMTCLDYQYELGKTYIIPPDEEVEECVNGFHLCLTLRDVFEHYPIADNNRFFIVKALVRKRDYDQYGMCSGGVFLRSSKKNKLVSRSIEFISECSIDEILSRYKTEKWTDEDKRRALLVGPETVEGEIIHKNRVEALVKLGYSTPFSEYIAESNEHYSKACIVASQPDVSMDVKVLTIFCGKQLKRRTLYENC